MRKENIAIIMLLVGVFIYFFPLISEFASNTSELTGIMFAVGGIILYYLPSAKKGK